MAKPRATARPWMENVMVSLLRAAPGRSLALAEFVPDEREDRVERLLLAITDRFDRHFAAYPGGEHHHAHDALAVHAPLSLAHPDLAREGARELRELGGRAGMKPQLI